MLNEKEQTLQLIKMTRLSKPDQVRLTRWRAKQTLAIQIRIDNDRKRHFYRLKETYSETPEVLRNIAALLLATDEYHKVLHNVDTKHSGQYAAKKMHIQIDSIKRRRKSKWDKIMDKQGDLLKLHDEKGCSFRTIAYYFRVFKKLNVSHTYIAKAYHSLKVA